MRSPDLTADIKFESAVSKLFCPLLELEDPETEELPSREVSNDDIPDICIILDLAFEEFSDESSGRTHGPAEGFRHLFNVTIVHP